MAVILGINTHHAGASAALLIDGQPVAAVAEERLNRVKYYAGFPKMGVEAVLQAGGLTFADVDHVAIGRDVSTNRLKKAEYAVRNPLMVANLMRMRSAIMPLDDLKALISRVYDVDAATLRFQQHHVEHHLAHIASAYFISPWDHAAGFSVDGSGDFVTCMLAECSGKQIDVKQRVYVPHSLGWLYEMVCQFVGYRKYGDEGKVMGLAPYGTDTYVETLGNALILTADGFQLDPSFFTPFGERQATVSDAGIMQTPRLYSDRMIDLFGAPREPGADITQRDKDLAYAVQATMERGYMHMLNRLHQLVPTDRVAMAGGVALNSVANGKLFDQTPFTETVIQPAAGDEGLALGAALYVSQSVLGEPERYVMQNAYLGPSYTDAEIEAALQAHDIRYQRVERQEMIEQTAAEIEAEKVVGWFQGSMEWGPRALGNRSILANPASPNMKDILNARIKHREWFRPFAPVVLAERQSDIFEHDHPSPYMLHVYKIRPAWRERLPAVNHVDDTGRLQSVSRDENPMYYDIVKAFGQRTGVPVLINTSFNENEPIVCNPDEAVSCYVRTNMDVLAIGPFMAFKGERTPR